jgi:transaldolase
LSEGVSINITLIFSLTRYDQVIAAFLDGLERAKQAGRDLNTIASVASFFVSRVDTEIDARLDKLDTPEARSLRGKTAIANARLAYQRYEQMLSSSRWQSLAAAGARPQRPLWASTSTKDPAYPDTRYVVDLVAPGVVNTMPEATLRAVADHGDIPADSIRDHDKDSAEVLARVEALGIDLEEALQKLEDDGLTNFDGAWTELSERLTRTLREQPHRPADRSNESSA